MATTITLIKTRVVREATVTLTYADTTSAEMFKLPENARIIAIIANVVTAFSGGTTELDVGTSSDPDYYADAISLASAGQIVPSTAVVLPGQVMSAVTPIYMNVGAGNTAGEVRVTVLFSMETGKPF